MIWEIWGQATQSPNCTGKGLPELCCADLLPARAALYLDGKLAGEIRDKDYPISMDWDLEKTGIYIAVSYIGLIDEFALFNRALTEDEIRLLRTQPAVLSSLKKRR